MFTTVVPVVANTEYFMILTIERINLSEISLNKAQTPFSLAFPLKTKNKNSTNNLLDTILVPLAVLLARRIWK